MPIVDNGVYVAGHRIGNRESLEQTFEYARAQGGMAWIGLFRPTPEEIAQVAEEFELHPLAVEDALSGHQRAKIERYGDVLFVVLRPARYIDELDWPLGYPMALGLMAATSVALYVTFRHRHWL